MMEILLEAKQKSVDNGHSPSISTLPGWLNPKLVNDGQDFIRRNFFSVFFAHFISLIFLLCYSPVRRVLMKTGKSDSTANSLKRYLSTLLHVQEWYEGDLLNLKGVTFNDIQRVRRIHSGVSRSVKILNDEDQQFKSSSLSETDNELMLTIRSDNCDSIDQKLVIINMSEIAKTSNLSISQLDMIVTQFCFMGFIFLFPQKVGIPSEESKGLNGFVHLWAVIGHLLGIEDRYNICLEQNGELRTTILYEVLLPDFHKCHPDTLVLWKSLISGLSTFIPFLRLKPVLLFIVKNILDLNKNVSSHLFTMLSKYERICYKAMSSCFNTWMKYKIACTILNFLLRFVVFITSKKLRVNINLKIKPDPNKLVGSVIV